MNELEIVNLYEKTNQNCSLTDKRQAFGLRASV